MICIHINDNAKYIVYHAFYISFSFYKMFNILRNKEIEFHCETFLHNNKWQQRRVSNLKLPDSFPKLFIGFSYLVSFGFQLVNSVQCICKNDCFISCRCPSWFQKRAQFHESGISTNIVNKFKRFMALHTYLLNFLSPHKTLSKEFNREIYQNTPSFFTDPKCPQYILLSQIS